MSRSTVSTRIKTTRPLSDSDLLNTMKASMTPIFEHLEEALMKRDGQVLNIRITAISGSIKLEYGISKL